MSLAPAFNVRCFSSSEGSTIPLSLNSSWGRNNETYCFSSELLMFCQDVCWNIFFVWYKEECLLVHVGVFFVVFFCVWQYASRSEGVSLRQDCLLPHSLAAQTPQEWPNLSCNCTEWIHFKTWTETFHLTSFMLFWDLMSVAFPCKPLWLIAQSLLTR